MKSSNVMIAIAAVLVAASFAGIVIINDEANAAEGDTFIITYQGDAGVLTQEVESGSTAILYSADKAASILGLTEEEAEVYEQTGWMTTGDNPVVYVLGASVKPSADMVLVPVIEVRDDAPVMFFIVGEDTFIIGPDDGDTTITITDEILEAVKVIEEQGYIMNGWFLEDGTEYESVAGDYPYAQGKTVTADLEKVYKVSWVVDGTTISSSNSNSVIQPEDPIKANYTFEGWSVDGTIVSNIVDGDIVVPKDYEYTADTVFVAEFKPVQLTITLMVGDEQYGTTTVLYGNSMVMPALPEGYAYWAIQSKEPVYGEDGTSIIEPAEYTEFTFPAVISSDMTLYAIAAETPEPDESIYATFNIEGTIYGPYKVTDRFSIPQTDREGYSFLGWTVQGGDGTKLTSAQVQNYQYTEDVTFVAVYEVVEPPAPEEPGFFETSTGKTAAVLIAFVIVLLIAAVYLNLWDLRTKLFGWKIERKGKE